MNSNNNHSSIDDRQLGDRKVSIIDEETTFKGTLTSKTSIVVMGKVEGDITAPALEITETGSLVGKAKVKEMRARGELSGEFDAEDAELGGRLRDGTVVRARSLLVLPGRPGGEGDALFGECVIEVGDIPSKEQAVSEALNPPKPVSSPSAFTPAAPTAAGGSARTSASVAGTAATGAIEAAPGAFPQAEAPAGGTGSRRVKKAAPDRPNEGA